MLHHFLPGVMFLTSQTMSVTNFECNYLLSAANFDKLANTNFNIHAATDINYKELLENITCR